MLWSLKRINVYFLLINWLLSMPLKLCIQYFVQTTPYSVHKTLVSVIITHTKSSIYASTILYTAPTRTADCTHTRTPSPPHKMNSLSVNRDTY